MRGGDDPDRDARRTTGRNTRDVRVPDRVRQRQHVAGELEREARRAVSAVVCPPSLQQDGEILRLCGEHTRQPRNQIQDESTTGKASHSALFSNRA